MHPARKDQRLALFCRIRSEEHTSELQSLRHLVCRLLLEKKNELQHRTAAGQTDRQRERERHPLALQRDAEINAAPAKALGLLARLNCYGLLDVSEYDMR